MSEYLRTISGHLLTNRLVARGVVCALALIALSAPLATFAQTDPVKVAGNLFLAGVLSPIVIVCFAIFLLAQMFLHLTGIIFNWAVFILVFEFAKHLGNSTGMLLAWSILRDFGNILLVFGFVLIGIQTILNVGHFSVGKALPRLVIFAVLLNFSLFVAEAVVDTTNVLSLALYQQSTEDLCADNKKMECLLNNGIAGQILTRLQVTTVNESASTVPVVGGFIDYIGNPIPFILKYVGLSVMIMTAAVVLLAGALLLISRGIALALLLVTSPIGFAGMAIPQLNEFADKWWKMLLNNAFFAPVFILLLFVSLKLMEGMQSLANLDGGLAAAISADGVIDTGPLFFFVLVTGFLIASLMAAKQFGVFGAEAVVDKAVGFIGHTAGFAVFGSMAAAGRSTIGAGSMIGGKIIRSGAIGRIPGVGKTLEPLLAPRLAGFMDSVSKKSFDFRGTRVFGDKLGQSSEDAKKGRYGVMEKHEERHTEYQKSIKETDEKKYKLLKSDRDRYREKLEEKLVTLGYDRTDIAQLSQDDLYAALAASHAFGGRAAALATAPEVTKMQKIETKMKTTTESMRVKETDKKEKIEEKVQEWNRVTSRIETVSNKLASIDREIANPNTTAARKAVLNAERPTHQDERNKLVIYQDQLEGSVVDLRKEIRKLREDIKKEESKYRKNVHDVASTPRAFGLNPLDRLALKKAVVGMRKEETTWKPKNLDVSIGRALREKLRAKGFNIPEP